MSDGQKQEQVQEQKQEQKQMQERERGEGERVQEQEGLQDNDCSFSDGSYETIDMTDNPMYQIMSAFLENDKGENLCDHINQLTKAVQDNTKMLEQFIKSTT